jgi:hypothetical protein
MNLAFGVLFLWFGASLLYVASHGLDAATPWAAFQTILSKARAAGPTTIGGTGTGSKTGGLGDIRPGGGI